MNKVDRASALFLILMATSSMMLFYLTPLGLAQSGTNVNGKISSDTTWTKAGSPYTFTGPVAVMSGVTLTVEPGATINLATYYLQINGTLNAKGTSSDKIMFSGGGGGMGSILFNRLSPSWNEATGKGSILQNAIVNIPIAINIGDTAPKIDSCQINGAIMTGDSEGGISIIPGIPLRDSAPIITNNVIVESSYSTVMQISTSPIINNNTIKGLIQTYGGSSFIRGNTIEGAIDAFGSEYIADNTIIGESDGYGIRTGTSPLIERNTIRNCRDGILLWYNHPNPTIRNNTITNCTNGLSVPGLDDVYPNPQVTLNNFIDNSQYNVNLYNHERDSSSNINAAYNYWGTTDQQTISQKIHDYKNDFNLGNVTYEPFLTAPNPQAMPNTEASLPTANPSPTPTSTPSVTPNATAASPSPTVPELPWLIILPLFVATLFVAMKIRHWKNNHASAYPL
jgi:parallel beta-helix repeat protein